MRVTPFYRGLPVILAIAAIFLGGCARSQTPRFYTLSPMPPDEVTSKLQSPARNAVVGIALDCPANRFGRFRRHVAVEEYPPRIPQERIRPPADDGGRDNADDGVHPP